MKKNTTTSTKTTKSSKAAPARRTRAKKQIEEIDEPSFADAMMDLPETESQPMARPIPRMLLVILALCLLAGLVGYRFRYLVVPAVVNGRPVFAWEYFSTLHKTYGSDVINTLTTEHLIEQEITKANVTVDNGDIDKEVSDIDKKASASGGLKAVLQAQRLTEPELRKQIRIQLAVKKILADKIKVTDQEIDDSFKKNKDFFKNTTEADAKQQIREQLENQKFQQEAGTWLNDIKSKAAIQINIPNVTAS